MKTILILLTSLTMYGDCFGQKDSAIYLGNITYFQQKSEESKIDTVKVFFLMTDTSAWSGQKLMGNWASYGQEGYEVRQCDYLCCDYYETMFAKYYWQFTHIAYLDFNKEILKPNIIVWMAKYLNQ